LVGKGTAEEAKFTAKMCVENKLKIALAEMTEEI
jgi:hypothetical protein